MTIQQVLSGIRKSHFRNIPNGVTTATGSHSINFAEKRLYDRQMAQTPYISIFENLYPDDNNKELTPHYNKLAELYQKLFSTTHQIMSKPQADVLNSLHEIRTGINELRASLQTLNSINLTRISNELNILTKSSEELSDLYNQVLNDPDPQAKLSPTRLVSGFVIRILANIRDLKDMTPDDLQFKERGALSLRMVLQLCIEYGIDPQQLKAYYFPESMNNVFEAFELFFDYASRKEVYHLMMEYTKQLEWKLGVEPSENFALQALMNLLASSPDKYSKNTRDPLTLIYQTFATEIYSDQFSAYRDQLAESYAKLFDVCQNKENTQCEEYRNKCYKLSLPTIYNGGGTDPVSKLVATLFKRELNGCMTELERELANSKPDEPEEGPYAKKVRLEQQMSASMVLVRS